MISLYNQALDPFNDLQLSQTYVRIPYVNYILHFCNM